MAVSRHVGRAVGQVLLQHLLQWAQRRLCRETRGGARAQRATAARRVTLDEGTGQERVGVNLLLEIGHRQIGGRQHAFCALLKPPLVVLSMNRKISAARSWPALVSELLEPSADSVLEALPEMVKVLTTRAT